MKRALVALASAALLAGPASGGVINVTNDSEMTTANTTAAGGDTVIIAAATYTVGINPTNSGTSGATITYRGDPTDHTGVKVPSLNVTDYCTIRWVQVNGGIAVGLSDNNDSLVAVTMRDTTATFSWNGDNNYATGLDVMAFRYVSEGSSPNNFDPPFDPAADNVMEDSKIYSNCTSGGANAVNLRAVLRNTYRRVMFHTRYGESMADAQGFGLYNVNNTGFYNCRFDLYNNKQGTQNNVKISIDVRDQVQHDVTEPSGFMVMQACTLLIGSAQYANDVLFSNGGTKANSGRNRYDSLLVIDRTATYGLNAFAYWQNHMEGDTLKNSVFVSSKKYPVWFVFKNDSSLIEHNTIVRVGNGTAALCWYCDGFTAVNDGGVTQNTDATNIARRNIIYGTAPSSGTSNGVVISKVEYGNQRINESLIYSPGGDPNYAVYRTDGIPFTPAAYDPGTPDSKWGNPKFLMPLSTMQSSAAMDSIVSWVFVQGKNPFALDDGSYAVNTPVNGNDWTDGYVGAFGPSGGSSGYLFASTTGSGTDCTEASPCGLQFAMSIAAAGDTVRLLAGNYAGDSSVTPANSGTPDDPIVIIGVSLPRVDSVIVKTSHVIVDSLSGTHAEILELDSASPVEYSQIRHGDFGQMWMSGPSNSTFLDCDVSGPVKVLGDWRSQSARNGEAFRDTLRRLRITDTLSTSAPRLFDVRWARDCTFDSLNVLGQLNATTDTVLARRVAYSVDCDWKDNRWRFSATGDGALAFAHGDSMENALFERETWEADSTGTYIVSAYLTRDDGDNLALRNTVYRDCWFILTGSNRLSGVTRSTTIDSTIFYSRHRSGLLMSGETYGLNFQFNTVYGKEKAIQSESDFWEDSGTLSNIFVADTLADSSSAVVSYPVTALFPYQWNFNVYYAYRHNTSTIKDVSQHAVAAEGLADSTMGVGGWTSRSQPKHPLLWGFDVTDGSSLWGDPMFSDTTFATLNLAPTAGSVAKRSDFPEGYSGAVAPDVDTTPPDDVSDLAALVNPGGNSVTLTWTEVGDDGSTGRAYVAYIAHEQKLVGQPSLLSSSTFEDYATPTVVVTPALPTETETVVMPIGSYYSGAQNYYMVKVCDGAGNCSYSNKEGPL